MQTNSKQANTMELNKEFFGLLNPAQPVKTTTELMGELKVQYTSTFTLECAVYRQLRTDKNARKGVLKYIGATDKGYNLVEIADLIRNHFDQLRLF